MEQRNKAVMELLNGTYTAIDAVIPVEHSISKPKLLKEAIHIEFGVLIGIVGDIKGKLMLAGSLEVFGAIGESMFDMALEGEMLTSFSGELGNMLAGRLSTTIVEKGINTDITSPTIMEGNTKLSGYNQALNVTVTFEAIGSMDVYLLLD